RSRSACTSPRLTVRPSRKDWYGPSGRSTGPQGMPWRSRYPRRRSAQSANSRTWRSEPTVTISGDTSASRYRKTPEPYAAGQAAERSEEHEGEPVVQEFPVRSGHFAPPALGALNPDYSEPSPRGCRPWASHPLVGARRPGPLLWADRPLTPTRGTHGDG